MIKEDPYSDPKHYSPNTKSQDSGVKRRHLSNENPVSVPSLPSRGSKKYDRQIKSVEQSKMRHNYIKDNMMKVIMDN